MDNKVLQALAAAGLVPLLTILFNPSYLTQLVHWINPNFPDLILPLITGPFLGIVGYLLYLLDPKGHPIPNAAPSEPKENVL
jgi:hypothetical protein